MRENGFIALTSVLILSALFLALVIGVATASVHTIGMQTATHHASIARSSADGCAQYALLQLVRSLHYTGNEERNIGAGTCEIRPVTEVPNGTRTIEIEGRAFEHVHRVVIEVLDIGPYPVIGSYESVTQF